MLALDIRITRGGTIRPKIRMTPKTAARARAAGGKVDPHKLLPLLRRGKYLYFIVRKGETPLSILRFFGKLGKGVIERASRELARVNPRKKLLNKNALFVEFSRITPGEFLLVPPSWTAPKRLSGTLGGLLGEGEDIDGGAVPPGDEGSDGDWSNWFGGGDFDNPDPADNPDAGDGDLDEVGNKFGIFCDEGFHREWSFAFPPVECVADVAGQPCEYVGDADADGKGYWYVGFKDRDGICSNAKIDATRPAVTADSPIGGKYTGAGKKYEADIWEGYKDAAGKTEMCGAGFAFFESAQACLPYTPKAGGVTTQTKGGTQTQTKGGTQTQTKGGTQTQTKGGTTDKGGTIDKKEPPATGIMATLTSPMAKKVYVALGVAIGLSLLLRKKGRSRRR